MNSITRDMGVVVGALSAAEAGVSANEGNSALQASHATNKLISWGKKI